MLVECLSVGRGITLPSNSTGSLKSIIRRPVPRTFAVNSRSPSARWKGSKEPLARIAGNTYVMDAAASLITYALVQGEKPAVLSAIVNHLRTAASSRSLTPWTSPAVKASCSANQLPARAYQGAPIAITVEGANILTRTMMIFGQARSAAILMCWMKWRRRRSNDLNAFDKSLFGHRATSAATGTQLLAGPDQRPHQRHADQGRDPSLLSAIEPPERQHGVAVGRFHGRAGR